MQATKVEGTLRTIKRVLGTAIAVIILVISSSFLIAPKASALQEAAGYGTQNWSTTTGTLELFNLTWEHESLGAKDEADFPIVNLVSPTATLHPNCSLEVENLVGNKVLDVTLQYYMPTVALQWSLGHRVEDFNFSFDYKPISYTGGGYTVQLVAVGSSKYCYFTYATGYSRVYLDGAHYATATPGAWSHFTVHWNARTGTQELFLNGVSQSSISGLTALQSVGLFVMSISAITAAGRDGHFMIDNITVTVPKHVIQPITSPFSDQTEITISFDDAYIGLYNDLLPMWSPHNFKATIAVPTARVGTANILTWTQLRDMVDNYSWELGGHGVDHENFLSRTIAYGEYLFQKVITDMQQNLSYTPTTWFWPGHQTNATLNALAQEYYNVVASNVWDNQTWEMMRSYIHPIYNSTTWNTYKYREYAMGADYSHYGLVDLYTHNVTDDPTSMDVYDEWMENFTDEVVARGLSFGTATDLYVPFRNWVTARITGDTNEFTLSHLRAYIDSTTWIEIAANRTVYGAGWNILNGTVCDLRVDAGTYEKMMVADTGASTIANVNVTKWTPDVDTGGSTIGSWTLTTDGSQTNYSFTGLIEACRYAVYQNGVCIYSSDGPTVQFSTNLNGSFTIKVVSQAVWGPDFAVIGVMVVIMFAVMGGFGLIKFLREMIKNA